MEDQERIECAALRFSRNILVRGVDNQRHTDLLKLSIESGLRTEPQYGFLTNFGEFVDRSEAADIAIGCLQITEPKSFLTTEDLW